MSQAERLTNALRLDRQPVGILFTDEAPDGVAPHGEAVPAGCSFWQHGSERTFFTVAADHESCAIGIYTHDLADAPAAQTEELQSVLTVLGDMEYATADDVALIPVMPKSSKHVVYGPLGELSGTPDVVMLFVDARQSLVVAEAAQQVEQGMAPAMGRPACAVVPQVVRSGKAAVSLGCCGARAYLDALSDDVALWALPGANLEAYVARVEALAGANDVLQKFHELRREDVEAGKRPTYAESMGRLQAAE